MGVGMVCVMCVPVASSQEKPMTQQDETGLFQSSLWEKLSFQNSKAEKNRPYWGTLNTFCIPGFSCPPFRAEHLRGSITEKKVSARSSTSWGVAPTSRPLIIWVVQYGVNFNSLSYTLRFTNERQERKGWPKAQRTNEYTFSFTCGKGNSYFADRSWSWLTCAGLGLH